MNSVFRTVSLIIALLIIIPAISSNAEAQKAKKKSAGTSSILETVIARVGSENITYSDLEKAFKKNMNRKDMNFFDISKDSLNEFLELYVKYRLKVLDAIGRGFDKDSSVLSDIQQNRKILAESFFFERKLIEPRVQEMLKLRDRELQFAFILFKFPAFPNTDTIATYIKAKATLNKLKSGADFTQLAKDSSEDKETAEKGGVIPDYVTSGKIQRPIEKALYSVKVGEVYPELVRFRDGYLIIKLLRSEPRVRIKASHILLSEGLDKDSAAVIRKADSILALIKKGVKFSMLAEENSNDPATAVKGGDFNAWYSRSSGIEGTGKRFTPQFEETMFKLKDGEISGKVFTEYGIHIIKRDSTAPFDKSADYDDLKKLYKRIYFENDKREFLDSIEKAFGFEVNKINKKSFLSFIDSNKTNLDSAWANKVPDELKPKELFKFNSKSHSVGDMIGLMNKRSDFRGLSTNEEGIKKAILKLVDPEAFEIATRNLENEYPEFAALIKEFKDGILLFKVEALEVWDKLKFDSTAARFYWDTTKANYRTPESYDISEIYVLTDTLANEIYFKAKSTNDFDALAEQTTQRQGFREKKGRWGKLTVKDSDLAKKCKELNAKTGDILKPMEIDKAYSIIKVNEFFEPRMKTFEEAIPDFAPEFQELMQKNLVDKWLSSVQVKNPVSIKTAEMEKVVKELKKSSQKKDKK